MSKNEEILNFIDSSFRLEGMHLSSRERQTIMKCLKGDMTFNDAVSKAIKKHRKPVF